jgi:hypothetical protein
MKNLIQSSVIALVIFAAFSFTAKAQDTTPPATGSRSGIRLSIGPDGGLPIGSFHDRYKWNIGGSVQADFPVYKDQLFVTLNAGFNNFFAKDNVNGVNAEDLQLIPVKAGLKFFPVSNFYVQGEAGASFIANKDKVGADKSTAFVYAPQIGYLFHLSGKNYIDAGVRFESNTKFTDNGGKNNFLGLRVAYAFGL